MQCRSLNRQESIAENSASHRRQNMASSPVNWNLPTHGPNDHQTRNGDVRTKQATRTTELSNNNRVAVVSVAGQTMSLSNSGSPVNRFPTKEHLIEEVAQRYQQIIQKEYKLLNLPFFVEGQSVPFQGHSLKATSPTSTQGKHGISSQCLPVQRDASSELLYLNNPRIEDQSFVSVNIGEEDDTNLPKIGKVFSLNPVLSTEHFQKHVTIEPSSRSVISISKENESSGRCGINYVNSFTWNNAQADYLKTKVAPPNDKNPDEQSAEGFANGFNPQDISKSRTKLCTAVTACIDLTNGEEEVSDAGFSTKGKLAGEDSVIDENDVNTEADNDVLQQTNLECDKNGNGGRKTNRKRKHIFGYRRRNKRSRNGDGTGNIAIINNNSQSTEDVSKGVCSNGSDNTDNQDHADNQNHTDNQDHADNQDNTDNQQGTDGQHAYGGNLSKTIKLVSNNSGTNDIEIDESERKEKKNDLNNNVRGQNGKKSNLSNLMLTDHKLNGDSSIGSEDDFNSPDVMSSMPGNNVRQSKILDLKARLAKQEEEILKLKRKGLKEPEKSFLAKDEGSVPEELASLDNGTERHCPEVQQRDVESFDRQNQQSEKDYFSDEDFDLKYFDDEETDLKGIYQHVIRSFNILNARFGKSANGITEEHGQIQSHLKTTDGSISKAGLQKVDVTGQDNFLSQLGLLRISADSK